MLEVHPNIVASNVGRHRNDWGGLVELSNEMRCRNAIEVGHDDIHKHKVVLGTGVELINSFESVHLNCISARFPETVMC